MIEFCWYATRVVILAAFVVLPLAMRCAERLPADDSSCCGPVDDCDWCDVGASGGTGGTNVDANPGVIFGGSR